MIVPCFSEHGTEVNTEADGAMIETGITTIVRRANVVKGGLPSIEMNKSWSHRAQDRRKIMRQQLRTIFEKAEKGKKERIWKKSNSSLKYVNEP